LPVMVNAFSMGSDLFYVGAILRNYFLLCLPRINHIVFLFYAPISR